MAAAAGVLNSAGEPRHQPGCQSDPAVGMVQGDWPCSWSDPGRLVQQLEWFRVARTQGSLISTLWAQTCADSCAAPRAPESALLPPRVFASPNRTLERIVSRTHCGHRTTCACNSSAVPRPCRWLCRWGTRGARAWTSGRSPRAGPPLRLPGLVSACLGLPAATITRRRSCSSRRPSWSRNSQLKSQPRGPWSSLALMESLR